MKQLKERIEILDAEQELFATLLEAQQYFRRASKRLEKIFVSYTGTDADIAEGLITVLKQRFKDVFDYNDIKAIRGGTQWISEVFAKIAEADVGVLLYSPLYFESGNCLHEAREILARLDMSKIKVVPVKLRDEELKMPTEFGSIQYLRRWRYSDWGMLVDSIIESIDG